MSGTFWMKNFLPDDPAMNLPMHPEDYAALLAWVRAKLAEEQTGKD
jgi:hypothetical protein